MSTQEVTVRLQSNVVYVTGTVNGVPVTWTQQNATDWRAVAERSEDNLYHVEITAINSAGTSADYALDLRYGLQLITDRTGPGKYDWQDFNRVGAAVRYLVDLLATYGYAVDAAPRSDWVRGDIASIAQLQRYLQDVKNLRSCTDAGSLMPELPEAMARITWTGANNIERVLELLEYYIFRMLEAWFYSGEIESGEV